MPLIFMPESHPDLHLVGSQFLPITEDALIPGMLFRGRNGGVYNYRRSGNAMDTQPIWGCLYDISEDNWANHFSYAKYLAVPTIPWGLAWVPSY